MLKPTLVSIVALDGRNDDELLALTTGTTPHGHTVVIGDAAQFAAVGLSIESLGDWPDRLRQRGQRVLFVAIDGRVAGLLGVIDV